jgi:hypothetical protein
VSRQLQQHVKMQKQSVIQSREYLKSQVYEELHSLTLLGHIACRRRIALCTWGCLLCNEEQCDKLDDVKHSIGLLAHAASTNQFDETTTVFDEALTASHLLGAMTTCVVDPRLYGHFQAIKLLPRKRNHVNSYSIASVNKNKQFLWTMSDAIRTKRR